MFDMNKILFSCLFLSLCLSGCNYGGDDIIWDYACHSVTIEVTDKAGNNLANPETPGNVCAGEPYVIYLYQKFELNLQGPYDRPETRYNSPSFLEFFLTKTDKGKYVLSFGEFSPSSHNRKIPFTIYWGDGTTDEVAFDLYVTGETKKNPTVHKAAYLNGKQVSDHSLLVSIIK